MLSAIFRGNAMIFQATGCSMLLGGLAGGLMMYSFQNEKTDIEYWNNLWSQYRSKYTINNNNNNNNNPFWESNDSILNINNNEYLKYLSPKLPKLTSKAQVKSIRIFIPLCGANKDMEIINNFFINKIKLESDSIEQSKQYQLKIIGVDSSKDAIQLFLDKNDIKERKIKQDIDYQKEYNFKNNKCLYQIDDEIFSKIEIYKHKQYNLINCNIFDASIPRLVLRADAIYDNKSLSIILPKRRSQYINLIKNIISRKCKILLVTERFDTNQQIDIDNDLPTIYPINSKHELFKLYKKLINMESKNIKLLNSIPWNNDKLKLYGLSEAFTDIWLIQCQKVL